MYSLGFKLCYPNIHPIEIERFTNPNICIQLDIHRYAYGNPKVYWFKMLARSDCSSLPIAPVLTAPKPLDSHG